jgi:two-component system CheB/CheR fusion protein
MHPLLKQALTRLLREQRSADGPVIASTRARRTAETSTTVEDFAAHLEGRLAALGRVQATVTRDPASGVSLATLVAEELLAHAAHEGEQATISCPTIKLRPKAAETLALAVHELSANAVKDGALSKTIGRVAHHDNCTDRKLH